MLNKNMSRQWREAELHRRRHRREKLKKLREKYKLAKTEAERAAIIEKAFKISPLMRLEDFLAPINKPSA